MTIPITDDTGQILGHAAGVIELANSGPDPQVEITTVAPGMSRIISRPRQPLRIGHVLGTVLDPGMFIATDGKIIPPEEAGWVNGECADCDSALVVLPNNEPGYLWYVIEHRRTCPAMAQWIADQR